MANVLYPPEELSARILKAAREAFMENGLNRTEMNDIAARAGLSRSTLYRFAADKTRLAYMISSEILSEITEKLMRTSEGQNGYEKLVHYTYNMIEAYEERTDVLCYLAEFDRQFSGAILDIPEAQEYENLMRKLAFRSSQFMFEGMADGSIQYKENPMLFMAVLNETILSILMRQFVRDRYYVETHREMSDQIIREAVHILLESIRAKPAP